MGLKKKIKILVLVLLAGALFWYGYKNYETLSPYFSKVTSYVKNYSRPEEKVRVVEPERTLIPQPSAAGTARTELDLNRDGRKEILLTSLEDKKPRAVLVDAENTDQKLSQVFDFSTEGFSKEPEVKPEEVPEPIQSVDLNNDGVEEIVLDLKDYGAYTDSFGVLSFQNGKLDWVFLLEPSGEKRPAVFRDGSSVRHANIFRILEEGDKKSLAQVLGEEIKGGEWSWEAEVFSWNGSAYAYNQALSEKILKEQPKRFENGEPVF